MPRYLALFMCLVFILWLFSRDQKFRPMTSGTLWIVLLWVMIIGSRPVSLWFNFGNTLGSIDIYLEGSPLDRNIFMLLIAAGFVVLLRRGVSWVEIISNNRWFFAFFAYCAISILWSDYYFVSLKRWVKDFGNIVIIIIIITETNVVQATKAVFSRYVSLAIPLSVIFNRYYPEFSRHFNRWSGLPSYSGITTNKNELGIVLTFCGLFLVWDVIEMKTSDHGDVDRTDLFGRSILIIMVLWQLIVAHSATAFISFMIGICILFCMQMPIFKRQIRYFGTYSLVAILFIYLYYSFFLNAVTEAVGRDDTFTGRTLLWADVLKVPINSLLGTGYKSFWLGPRLRRISELYYWQPNQAHNGYLETYLNLGFVGVSLLTATIIATGHKIKKILIRNNGIGKLIFTYFIVALFYNLTEAMFNSLNLIWFVFIYAALYYSPVMSPEDSDAEYLTES